MSRSSQEKSSVDSLTHPTSRCATESVCDGTTRDNQEVRVGVPSLTYCCLFVLCCLALSGLALFASSCVRCVTNGKLHGRSTGTSATTAITNSSATLPMQQQQSLHHRHLSLPPRKYELFECWVKNLFFLTRARQASLKHLTFQ